VSDLPGPIDPAAVADVAARRAGEIAAAVAALRRGELVGLPTETVYGLAADAANPAAVARIFALKGRPADHPLIVHLDSAAQLAQWCAHVPAQAEALAAAFWPGPLTMILPRAAWVPDAVTGGQDTVGLRCPAHPLALAVLQAFGGGLAAPSANRFGRISPTRAAHVRDEFGDRLPIVLDGGDCAIGIESTIVDLSGAVPRILRPGRISRTAIEGVIGLVRAGGDASSPRASGTLEAHYAPRTPMLLLSRGPLLREAREQSALGKRPGLLLLGALPDDAAGRALPALPDAYAQGLYASLRALDAEGHQVLLVERPPDAPEWTAVLDRLRRATAGAGDEAAADAP
jgi:L-threonylcarbamoyladenylate synthase